MCEYLHIGENEDPYVREVATMALNAPMPDGWEEVEDDAGNLMFRCVCVGGCKRACPPCGMPCAHALHASSASRAHGRALHVGVQPLPALRPQMLCCN